MASLQVLKAGYSIDKEIIVIMPNLHIILESHGNMSYIWNVLSVENIEDVLEPWIEFVHVSSLKTKRYCCQPLESRLQLIPYFVSACVSESMLTWGYSQKELQHLYVGNSLQFLL